MELQLVVFCGNYKTQTLSWISSTETDWSSIYIYLVWRKKTFIACCVSKPSIPS